MERLQPAWQEDALLLGRSRRFLPVCTSSQLRFIKADTLANVTLYFGSCAIASGSHLFMGFEISFTVDFDRCGRYSLLVYFLFEVLQLRKFLFKKFSESPEGYKNFSCAKYFWYAW